MRQYLELNDKFDEIKMLSNHFDYRDRHFIILEGETDIRLFRSLFSDRVQSESVSGKQNVINIVKKLRNDGINLIAGICDADFDHILNQVPNEEFIFVTDFHDIEIMLLNSSALHSVISEYAVDSPAEQLLKESLLDDALSAGKQIGILRLINHIHDLQLNFKGINFDSFSQISSTEIRININDLVSELLQRSSGINPETDATKILQYYTLVQNRVLNV